MSEAYFSSIINAFENGFLSDAINSILTYDNPALFQTTEDWHKYNRAAFAGMLQTKVASGDIEAEKAFDCLRKFVTYS